MRTHPIFPTALALLAAVCLAGPAAAQVAPPAAVEPAARPAAPAVGPVVPAPSEPGAQDVIFLGDTRPVLFRLHVRVNGKSFASNWDEFLDKLFAYYDTDGDGVLTKKETQRIIRAETWLSLLNGSFNYFGNGRPGAPNDFARPEEIDTNKDGKITREELRAYYRRLGAGGLRGQAANQNGLSGRLTRSLFRHLDLNGDGKLSREEVLRAPESLHKLDMDDDEMIAADEQFKAAAGAKGYIDAKDVMTNGQVQFLRGLLPLADRDGDGKLYEKELSAFLDLAGLGASAHLYLRVTDNGRGLFELMDADGDGRLSVRELRTAWERIKPYDRSGKGLIAETDIPRQFQLTLEQGTLSYPFGFATIVPAGRRGTKQAPPRGPSWFRKTDRNGDGDVSRREWLGTEEDFRRLDADGDGLISAEEAERGEAALKKEQKAAPKAAAAPAARP